MAEYIEREALMAEHEQYITEHPEVNLWTWSARLILNAPAADVRPVVRGKWVEKKHATMCHEDYFCRMALSCSICGHEIDYGRGYGPNYCGNCGADMREENNNED